MASPSDSGSDLGSDVWIEDGKSGQRGDEDDDDVILVRQGREVAEEGGIGDHGSGEFYPGGSRALGRERGGDGHQQWPWEAAGRTELDVGSEVSWPSEGNGEEGDSVMLLERAGVGGGAADSQDTDGEEDAGDLQDLLDSLPAPVADASPRGGLPTAMPPPRPPVTVWHFAQGSGRSGGGAGGGGAAEGGRGGTTGAGSNDHAAGSSGGEQAEGRTQEQMEALMRAKDRVLGERQAAIDKLSAELEAAVGHGHAIASEKDKWRSACEELQKEGVRLRERLGQANTTIEVLTGQGERLQEQLALCHASIEELHERVRGLQSGDDIMTAAQYEHHLVQVEAKWREEKGACGEREATLRDNVARLEQEVARLAEEAGRAEEARPGVRECGVQCEGPKETADARVHALEGLVRSLECEVRSTKQGVAFNAKPPLAGEKGLAGRMRAEMEELRRLNEEMIEANRGLGEANARLMRESGRAVCERERKALDDTERRRWGEAKESELRKISEVHERAREAAVTEAVEQGRRALEARERQLQINKEGEVKRLRAAWDKNKQESIKAVEQRYALPAQKVGTRNAMPAFA